MDDANKEFWRVGCQVADMGRNTGMVVLHSRTVLAVQAEIERLRTAPEDACKVLVQLVPYSSDDDEMAHMEQLRTSALESVRWALGPNAAINLPP